MAHSENGATWGNPLYWGVLTLLTFFLTSCCSTPGKGWKAKEGYRAAEPIISALEQYLKDRGNYPEQLDDLVPAYLPNAQAFLVRGKAEVARSPRARDIAPPHSPGADRSDWFNYQRELGGYNLSFEYSGVCLVRCTYSAGSRSWTARGYY